MKRRDVPKEDHMKGGKKKVQIKDLVARKAGDVKAGAGPAAGKLIFGAPRQTDDVEE